jgi:hypothetical protein
MLSVVLKAEGVETDRIPANSCLNEKAETEIKTVTPVLSPD